LKQIEAVAELHFDATTKAELAASAVAAKLL
jgi:hypothetical protein